METSDANQQPVLVAANTAQSTRVLPGPIRFLELSVTEAWQRLDLLAWYLLYAVGGFVATMVVGGFVSLVLFMMVPSTVGIVLGSIAALTALLAMIYILTRCIGALMFAVAHGSTMTFRAGWQWMHGRVLSLMWAGALFAAAVFTGFVFLIIPGVVILVYLYFYQYVFVKESRTGVAALQRSFDVVRGHWWGIFGRALLLQAVFIAISVGLVMVFTALRFIAVDGAETMLLVAEQSIAFVVQIFSILVTIMSVRVLYESLTVGQDATTPVTGSKILPIFMWLAIPLILISTVAVGLVIGAVMTQLPYSVDDTFAPAPIMEMDASFEDMTDEEFEAYILEQLGAAATAEQEEMSQ